MIGVGATRRSEGSESKPTEKRETETVGGVEGVFLGTFVRSIAESLSEKNGPQTANNAAQPYARRNIYTVRSYNSVIFRDSGLSFDVS